MKSGGHGNAMMIELLIAIAFFLLCSSVIIQFFAAALNQSRVAGDLQEAQTTAQNIAQILYNAEDTEKTLTDMGYSIEDGAWRYEEENFVTEVRESSEVMEAGILRSHNISIIKGDEALFSLVQTRYEEGRP